MKNKKSAAVEEVTAVIMNKNGDFWKKEGLNIAKIVVGCLIYSLSVVLFLDSAHIIPGSVTGIGVVAKAVAGIPIGVLNLVINVPLVIIGTIVMGKRILLYTGLTVFLNSVMMDGLAFLHPFTEDLLLASIFGGVIMGIGLGLILDGGGSTGGTTLVGHLVLRKLPHLPMGSILLVGDFMIITAGSIILKNWDLFLYSLLDLYICVVVIDMVMYGYKVQGLQIIRTSKPKEIESAIAGKVPCQIVSVTEDMVQVITKKKDMGTVQIAAQAADPDCSCTSYQSDHTFGDLYRVSRVENSPSKAVDDTGCDTMN